MLGCDRIGKGLKQPIAMRALNRRPCRRHNPVAVVLTNRITLFRITLGHRVFEAIIKRHNRNLIQIKGIFNCDRLAVLRITRSREDRKSRERCGE